jgi:hypothetical protein
VDESPHTYTTKRLIGFKATHEEWVSQRLAVDRRGQVEGPSKAETLHSTILPVETLPPIVYSAPAVCAEEDVKGRLLSSDGGEMLPFIVRENRLQTFWDLESDLGPFEPVVERGGEVVASRASEWWDDPDLSRWYVTLLNRSLNKLTGRLGLNLDKEHNRYFFEAETGELGEAMPAERVYRSLNRANAKRSVVWRPTVRKTGKPKNHWVHLAVSLRFHRVTADAWVLSVRPERRFTVDGRKPLVPKATGRRSTSAKSHMYNYDVLKEVQFWKDYLSNGTPFIEFDFGKQNLLVSSASLSVEVTWPGVPDDDKPYENVRTEFDLFSARRYFDVVNKNRRPEAELELWELEDLGELESEGHDG